MSVVYPNLVPSYITIGQREQELIIEYPIDLPHDLMTLTVLHPGSNDEAMARTPTTSIGPRTAKIKLPAFKTYGMYTVIPRFPANQHNKFPPFQLRVLSAVETLIHVLAPEEDPYHDTAAQATAAVIAPLLAYLIQNEQQGVDEDPHVVDQVLSQIFPCLEEPIISLSEYLCGKYANKGETLLHFCVRHRFVNTCQVLTQQFDSTSLRKSLEMRGFDGKTPLDISEANEDTSLSIILKSASSKEETSYHQQPNKDQSQSSEHKHHRMPKPGKFGLIRSVLKKIEKINDSHQSSSSSPSEDTGNSGGPDLSQPLLKHLKLTALYSAEVMQSYHTVDKEFGTISLQVGEIAYVTREEDQHWCTGIVNDRYCRFPRSFLRPLKDNDEGGSNNSIPSAKALLESKEIRDFEELETLVDQRNKFADYAKEKQTRVNASNRFSYLSPVTRSCSVETGLDEISNCSPLLKRAPLPALPKKSHMDIPLPPTPSSGGDGIEDSDGEYEPVELGGGAPRSPRIPIKMANRPNLRLNTTTVPATAATPSTRTSDRQQSPLVNRKELPPIPIKGNSKKTHGDDDNYGTRHDPYSVRQQHGGVSGVSRSESMQKDSSIPIKGSSSSSGSRNTSNDSPRNDSYSVRQQQGSRSGSTQKELPYGSTSSVAPTYGVSPSQLRKGSLPQVLPAKSSPSANNPKRGRAASDDAVTIGQTASSLISKQQQLSKAGDSSVSTGSDGGDVIIEGGLSDDEYEDASSLISKQQQQLSKARDSSVSTVSDGGDVIIEGGLSDDEYEDASSLKRNQSDKSVTSNQSTMSEYENLKFMSKREEEPKPKVSISSQQSTSLPSRTPTSSISSTIEKEGPYSPSTATKKKPIPPPVQKKPTLNKIPPTSTVDDIPPSSKTTIPTPAPVKTSINKVPTNNTWTAKTTNDQSPKLLPTTTSNSPTTNDTTSCTSPKSSTKPPPPTRTTPVKQQNTVAAAQSVKDVSKKFEQRAWRY